MFLFLHQSFNKYLTILYQTVMDHKEISRLTTDRDILKAVASDIRNLALFTRSISESAGLSVIWQTIEGLTKIMDEEYLFDSLKFDSLKNQPLKR